MSRFNILLIYWTIATQTILNIFNRKWQLDINKLTNQMQLLLDENIRIVNDGIYIAHVLRIPIEETSNSAKKGHHC